MIFSRTAAIAAALLASFGIVSCAPREPEREPPNVLLLVVDCLRADRFGSPQPYDRELTANLDAVAAAGVSFSRAFTQAPWTRPSLPTLLTGLYPAEHGLVELDSSSGGASAGTLPQAAQSIAEVFSQAGYRTAMIGEQHQLAPQFGLARGFDHYNHKGSKAHKINQGFAAWLDKASGGAADGRPKFFAYLHFLELHWPYCPPHDVRGLFTPGYEGRSFCFQWRQLRQDLRSGAVVLSSDELEAMKARYDEELLALDREIGRLWQELRQRGLWDETLIAVTSDHGEEFFEHGGMGHGTSLFDELIAVPLVIKPPASWGVPVGRIVEELVELRDLPATLVAAAGLGPLEGSTARSLLPWIEGRADVPGRDFVVAEHQEAIAIRTRDHKLVVRRDGTAVDLYDLRADPGERRPVTDADPERVSLLSNYLRQWRRSLAPLTAEVEELDRETIEGLRDLGYIE